MDSKAQSGMRRVGALKQKQSRKTDVLFRKAKTVKFKTSMVLQSTPRPTFPSRISSLNVKESNRSVKIMEESREDDVAASKCSWAADSSRRNNVSTEHAEAETKMAESETARVLTTLSEADELDLLQSVYYQLCFAEAKAEDTFRRQEQRAEVNVL